MQITYKTDKVLAHFREITTGDIFSVGETLFMRIEECKSHKTAQNAVELETGMLFHFEDDEDIAFIDAQLLII